MAYCRRCGAPISDHASVCPSCGAPQNTAPQVEDNGGIGWGLLGCCIPVVGLVLYLVWRDTKPNTARAAGIGALVAVGLYVVYYMMVIVAGVGFALL